jgi:hypothetical protein
MFKKNPNQYFYRHNEPEEEQWVHDWSEEEKNLFLKVKNVRNRDLTSVADISTCIGCKRAWLW